MIRAQFLELQPSEESALAGVCRQFGFSAAASDWVVSALDLARHRQRPTTPSFYTDAMADADAGRHREEERRGR